MDKTSLQDPSQLLSSFRLILVSRKSLPVFDCAEVVRSKPATKTYRGSGPNIWMEDKVLAEWGYGTEESVGCRRQVSVQDDLAARVDDADVHLAGVKVDATGVLMAPGVESHSGFLLWNEGFGFPSKLPRG
jgi:hypothetical protein